MSSLDTHDVDDTDAPDNHVPGPDEYLSHLGVYGWKSIERVVMAALVAQKPILLIGAHGTSKTTFAKAVSYALIKDCRFKSYNTPVLRDEELLGVLNPARLKKGDLDYIKTPTSIWGVDAVNLDEITRASPFTVNKCYEIVLSRTVNGKKTNIKAVFATANPPKASRGLGYHASYLDLAMASRFACIVTPEAKDLFDSKCVDDVIKMSLSKESFSLEKLKDRPDFGEDFSKAIARAKASYAMWSNKSYTSKIIQAVKAIAKKMDYTWQPRDMQSFASLVKAAVCLEQATGIPTTLEDWNLILSAACPQFTGIVKESPPADIEQFSDILLKLEFKAEHKQVSLPAIFDDKTLLSDPLVLLNTVRDIASSVTDPREIFEAACKLWNLATGKSKKLDLEVREAEAEAMGLISYGMTLENWWECLPDDVRAAEVAAATRSGDVLALITNSLLNPKLWKK